MKKLLACMLLGIVLSCTGCGKSKDQLVICTYKETYEDVKLAVKQWKESNPENSSIDVQIVTIPQDETAGEIKVTEIRTEIMAGEGPDVFIMRTYPPLVEEEARKKPLLFTNPEKSMYSEIFLPLDSYLEQFQYLDLEDCNQVVLEAGQTEEGQMLLPLIHEYYLYMYPEGFDAEIEMERLYEQPRGFAAYLGAYADYQKEELLVSKEELVKLFEIGQQMNFDYEELTFEIMENHFLKANIGKRFGQSNNFFAIPNGEGGVTANVSVYAGINRNTRVAEEAASFLDNFCNVVKLNPQYPFYSGIFIEQDEELQEKYRKDYLISEEDIEAISNMNESITDVRFYSTWDYDVIDAYWSLTRNPPTSNIQAMVDELYQKMQMQIKE